MDNTLEFGIPKVKRKEKLDYFPEKMVLTIVRPSKEEKTTKLVLNSTASKVLDLSKGSLLAFSFSKDLVVNVSSKIEEADGKNYFDVYQQAGLAGCYILNKPSAEYIVEKYAGSSQENIVHIELSLSELDINYPILKIKGALNTETVNYNELVQTTTNEA